VIHNVKLKNKPSKFSVLKGVRKEIKLDQNVLALKTESNWARKKRLYKIIEWKKMRGKLDLTWSQFRRLTGLPKQLFVKKSIFHKCKFGNTLTWTCTGCASIFPWLCRFYKYTKKSFFARNFFRKGVFPWQRINRKTNNA